MPNQVRHGKRLFKQMAMEVAVRNPERYPAILAVFAKYEGKVLDDGCILEIYKDLFVYRAIESDRLDMDNSSEDDIRNFIKKHLTHNNEWGFPTGYQAGFTRYLKTLSELGFIYTQYNDTIGISEVAKALLDNELEVSEAFALQCMRFWRKSPYRRVLNDFNYFAFILKVLLKLKESNRSLSYPQFILSLFSDNGDVDQFINQIQAVRIGNDIDAMYGYIVDTYSCINDLHPKVNKQQTVVSDYGNTVFRVLQLTGLISVENKSGILLISINENRKDLYEFANYDISKLKFVLTARTAINKTKYRNLMEKLYIDPHSIKLIDINFLSKSAIDALAQILKSQRVLGKLPVPDNYDAIAKFISNECKSKFCDLLLELYNSSDIKLRLTQLFSEISNESKDFKNVLIFSLMKPVMGLNIDLLDFENLLEINHALFSTSENSIINELFEFKDNEPIVKSSIVAKNILYNVISIDNMLELSKSILIACQSQNRFNDLQINLMSHTHYTIFNLSDDNLFKILNFYDSLRNYYKDNHFFWEQYALICIHIKDYRTADACITTAYQIVKNNNSFVPFQIDTIYGNCLFSELIDDKEKFSHEEAIEKTREACCRILRNIDHVDNDKYRAFKQLSRISQIYSIFKDKFDSRDKSIFNEISHNIITVFTKHQKSGECSFVKEIDKWITNIKNCK